MAKRFYTCIIVPHASARLHKLRIPERLLHFLAGIGTISFFVAIALGFNFIRVAIKISDYEQLQLENHDLQIEKKKLEASTNKLNSQLSVVENTLEKITKVIESDPTLKRLAVQSAKGAVGSGVGGSGAGGSKVDYSTAQLLKKAQTGTELDGLTDRAAAADSQSRLLATRLEYLRSVIQFTPTTWPLKGNIGSRFGRRSDPFTGEPDVHRGLDIIALYGAAIRAPAEGKVIMAGWMSDYGNLIVLEHKANGITTRYGHLSRFSVKVGQSVKKGDTIGFVGTTGRTTAPHLHYEVRVNDRPMDPLKYLLP